MVAMLAMIGLADARAMTYMIEMTGVFDMDARLPMRGMGWRARPACWACGDVYGVYGVYGWCAFVVVIFALVDVGVMIVCVCMIAMVAVTGRNVAPERCAMLATSALRGHHGCDCND